MNKKKCALIAWFIRYVVCLVVVLIMNRASISKKNRPGGTGKQ